jgi:hypothetical protein
MGHLAALVLGFFLGVAYMNGTLDEFGDITVNLVNAGAEKIVEATEPTALEKIEKKVVDIAQQ